LAVSSNPAAPLWSLWAVALGALALLLGCGAGPSRDLLSPAERQWLQAHQGRIVLAVEQGYAPFVFQDADGRTAGLAHEHLTLLEAKLGVRFERKPYATLDEILRAVRRGEVQTVNAVSPSPERLESLAFTTPYLENRQIVIVVAASPIKTKADLAGKVVGLQEGSSAVEAVEKDAVAKSIKTLKKFGDNVAALMDLTTGRLDALVVDEVVGRYYIAKKPNEYAVLDENFGTEEYGVGVRKDDTELLGKLQKAMDEMKKDGSAGRISTQWFGKDIVK